MKSFINYFFLFFFAQMMHGAGFIYIDTITTDKNCTLEYNDQQTECFFDMGAGETRKNCNFYLTHFTDLYFAKPFSLVFTDNETNQSYSIDTVSIGTLLKEKFLIFFSGSSCTKKKTYIPDEDADLYVSLHFHGTGKMPFTITTIRCVENDYKHTSPCVIHLPPCEII